MAKQLTPTSIKFTLEQRRFLKGKARKAKHRNISRVVKDMVEAARLKEAV